MFGLLGLLWSISYFEITVVEQFYLAFWESAGIYGGYGLAVLTILLFLVGAFSDSEAWTYFAIDLLIEPALTYAAQRVFSEASRYYIWVEAPVKIPEPEPVPEPEPEEPEP